MRTPPAPCLFTAILCGLSMVTAGCGNPSSATLASLSITATPSTLTVGGSAVLKAMAHLSDGTTQDVTAGTAWTLSNTAFAAMSNGALTAKAPGSVTVQAAYVETTPAGTSPSSATVAPENLTSSTQVTITAATSPGAAAVPVITWNTPAAISYGTPLSNSQLSAAANVPGTFSYTPAAGTVLHAGKQTLAVTFTPNDTKTYSAAVDSVQLAVGQAAPAITWTTPAAIIQGTALNAAQLNATANVPGSFMYSPAAGAVLSAGTQQLTAVFSPTDATDYSSATAHASVVVNPPASNPTGPTTPTITWNAPASISYGTALGAAQLDASANVPGTFTYTPASGTVLKARQQTLSVTFTPTDTSSYSTATATVQLTVNQAAPVITWATPAAVNAGAKLSAAQLDATASVPGSFAYSPAAGTVLAAGTLPLTAIFSPTDATDYSSVTAHTTLAVNAAPSGPTLPTPTGCGGPTINLNSGMSQTTLQNTINAAPSCALIVFAAGTYQLSSSLTIPCTSNLTLTGPVASPATAIISGSFPNSNLFALYGCSGVTIEYLGFNGGDPAAGGGSAIYVGPGSNNITISYNNIWGMQANASNSGSMAGIFFDGNATQFDSNLVMNWNTFGAQGDCSTVMNVQVDDGGLCSAILFQNSNTNVTANNNTVSYLEEGFKILPQRYCGNCTFDNNDFGYIHRIAIEFQVFTAKGPLFVEHNSFHDFVDSYYSTMGISTPCCFDGSEAINSTVSDNVLIANTPAPNSPPEYIPFAIEFWGYGSLAQNNLIQGYWANGITWGYVNTATAVQYNNICGPNMAATNDYVSNEEHTTTALTTTPNTTSATCSTVSSTPPTISPAAGAIAAATTITLSDSGMNHSIYYTIDGSTPTTSSTLYTGPFAVGPGTTVKAIGMWGQGANAKSYPAGYGYVPSAVVSASYTASVAPAPVSKVSARTGVSPVSNTLNQPSNAAAAVLQSVTITPSQAVVSIGSTTQLKATAAFSDGSVKDVTSEFGWQSSDARTITANASGMMDGLATGPAVISGSYQGMQASTSATSSIGDIAWSAPIVITQGGTYSGNWQSTDAGTPAVTVSTTAPVIIQNSHLRSAGSLITIAVAGSNLTVRNSLGVALNSQVKGQPNGVFLEVTSPINLDVENNYVENARGGVIVHGYSGNKDGEQSIVVRANRARNLNGLLSDGNGGYLAGEGANRASAQFIQLDSVQAVPGIDLGWNEVINYPGHSLVDTDIDIYRSGGTPNRPLEVHDTYLEGAYPYQPAQDAFTGGGIKTDAKAGDSAQEVPAFNSIHDNQVVATVNYGIDFAAGHDNLAFNNRVISSGLLADGTKIAAQQVGITNGDATGGGSANGSMYNNTMHDNLIGWACWKVSCASEGYRRDQYFPASPSDYSTNSVLAPGQITLNMEDHEYHVWVNKMATAGVAVGPSF